MSERPPSVSDFSLERYVADELPPDEARRIAEESARDEALAARIAAIRASNAEILSAYPPAAMARRIEARLEKEPSREGPPMAAKPSPHEAAPQDEAASPAEPPLQPRTSDSLHRGRGWPNPRRSAFLWALPAAAALAIGIGLAFAAGYGPSSREAGLEANRMKGGSPHLVLYRKTASGAERLAEGAPAGAADILQVGYYSGAKGYGAIFSIDGRGGLSFHLPEGHGGGSAMAAEIGATGESLLPSAYELDDAPYYERFFFVFSPRPFPLSDIEGEALALAARPRSAETADLSLRAGLSWSSFLIIKGKTR